jgi:hypothetical protein
MAANRAQDMCEYVNFYYFIPSSFLEAVISSIDVSRAIKIHRSIENANSAEK